MFPFALWGGGHRGRLSKDRETEKGSERDGDLASVPGGETRTPHAVCASMFTARRAAHSSHAARSLSVDCAARRFAPAARCQRILKEPASLLCAGAQARLCNVAEQ